MTEEEDRISLLPDCLLLEIISRIKVKIEDDEEERLMTTKEVIQTTSTISKRWQHLWTKLPTLNFTCCDDLDVCNYNIDQSDYVSFIDKTLTHCLTDLNLNKFKLRIVNNTKSQVYSWIQHAITRNVKELDLAIDMRSMEELDLTIDMRSMEKFSYDQELFFNNACLLSIQISNCTFNPPNGAIRWHKLKCLCIEYGKLDEELMGKILSGSPCLETLALKYCRFDGSLLKSLFRNVSVERLTCGKQSYKSFINGDEEVWDDLDDDLSMKLVRCVSKPPNGWGNLNFLCLEYSELDEDSIGKILSRSPCLETLELYLCYGVRRIDVASTSVKNLVLSHYGYIGPFYIGTLEINAPYVLSLSIKGRLDLEKILLVNISSLVKAELDYVTRDYFVEKLGRTREDIEDELLKGILTNLGHVNEITLRNKCLEVSSRLKMKTGFQRVHLNWCHGFYLFIIILLFSLWLAVVSKTGLLAY